jgi:hypothetical protein
VALLAAREEQRKNVDCCKKGGMSKKEGQKCTSTWKKFFAFPLADF